MVEEGGVDVGLLAVRQNLVSETAVVEMGIVVEVEMAVVEDLVVAEIVVVAMVFVEVEIESGIAVAELD